LALGLTAEPLVGGISKWASTRDDLLARDAACAAAARAANAFDQHDVCIESVIADMAQVDALRAQMVAAAERALADGALSLIARRRVRFLSARVGEPPLRETARTAGQYERKVARYHRRAALALGRVCRLLASGRGR
jgi:hypothetical protein